MTFYIEEMRPSTVGFMLYNSSWSYALHLNVQYCKVKLIAKVILFYFKFILRHIMFAKDIGTLGTSITNIFSNNGDLPNHCINRIVWITSTTLG